MWPPEWAIFPYLKTSPRGDGRACQHVAYACGWPLQTKTIALMSPTCRGTIRCTLQIPERCRALWMRRHRMPCGVLNEECYHIFVLPDKDFQPRPIHQQNINLLICGRAQGSQQHDHKEDHFRGQPRTHGTWSGGHRAKLLIWDLVLHSPVL